MSNVEWYEYQGEGFEKIFTATLHGWWMSVSKPTDGPWRAYCGGEEVQPDREFVSEDEAKAAAITDAVERAAMDAAKAAKAGIALRDP